MQRTSSIVLFVCTGCIALVKIGTLMLEQSKYLDPGMSPSMEKAVSKGVVVADMYVLLWETRQGIGADCGMK